MVRHRSILILVKRQRHASRNVMKIERSVRQNGTGTSKMLALAGVHSVYSFSSFGNIAKCLANGIFFVGDSILLNNLQ